LSQVVETYNNLQHSSTKMTPNFVELGYHPQLKKDSRFEAIKNYNNINEEIPLEAIRQKTLVNNKLAAERNEKRWNKRAKSVIFEVGTIVLVRDIAAKKVNYPWTAKIIRRYDNNLYRLQWEDVAPPGEEPGAISNYAISTNQLKPKVIRPMPLEVSSINLPDDSQETEDAFIFRMMDPYDSIADNNVPMEILPTEETTSVEPPQRAIPRAPPSSKRNTEWISKEFREILGGEELPRKQSRCGTNLSDFEVSK
jgi:hypothetical protein